MTEITYNIDLNVHKTPYQLFRTVRGGTRCSSPSIVFSVWKRSSNCRHFNVYVSAQGIEARGTPFPMVLKHEAAKPPLLNI